MTDTFLVPVTALWTAESASRLGVERQPIRLHSVELEQYDTISHQAARRITGEHIIAELPPCTRESPTENGDRVRVELLANGEWRYAGTVLPDEDYIVLYRWGEPFSMRPPSLFDERYVWLRANSESTATEAIDLHGGAVAMHEGDTIVSPLGAETT